MERTQMGFKASKKTREIIRHATKEFGLSQQDTIEEIILEWAELKQNAGSTATAMPQTEPVQQIEEPTVEPVVETVVETVTNYENVDKLKEIQDKAFYSFKALHKRMAELGACMNICNETEIAIPSYGYERLDMMNTCLEVLEHDIYGGGE